MAELKYKTTQDIKIPESIVDQVIGQEKAVEIIRKAAEQRRHVFLIGDPGTGKSMLGLALAELLPKSKLMDIVSFANPNDENAPLIRTVPAGQGRDLVAKARMQGMAMFKNQNLIMFILVVLAMLIPWWTWNYYDQFGVIPAAIMTATSTVVGLLVIIGFTVMVNMGRRGGDARFRTPKVVVDNFGKQAAPFNDATGAHAGALLGDVLHDPFQSGGLGTPAHERVVAGMIHKSHMGVLFVDEVATLDPSTQQELLSAMQEKKFSITGQSERSAGAMVRTEPVPCDFVMVAAGNLDTLKHMHPALRSRIRGYGYEVYMKETMEDTKENQDKIAIFVAQEVSKDKKIPHFSKEAVDAILDEARRRANRKGHLTLRLRELGGIIRASGDLAVEKKSKVVEKEHVLQSVSGSARTLEQQIADKYIERKKEYQIIVTDGKKVGRVNGLAVIGDTPPYSGIILPIEAEVTPGGESKEIIATGKLGEIAKEAVKNVAALIKKYFGADLKTFDIYVQFLQTHDGVEGDSASIAVATAIISAYKKVPIRQDFAMTGSLSVRGEVLPIGGVTAKVEAAIEAGIKNVIVPKSNLKDIVLSNEQMKKINIIPVEKISEVLEQAIEWKGKDASLEQMKKSA